MGRIFIPHELKTIEVDTEKKVFKINGEDIGKDCAGFTITCMNYGSFDIRVEVDTTVKFISIRDGKCVKDIEHPVRESWYST
jgi:hypothetical protein